MRSGTGGRRGVVANIVEPTSASSVGLVMDAAWWRAAFRDRSASLVFLMVLVLVLASLIFASRAFSLVLPPVTTRSGLAFFVILVGVLDARFTAGIATALLSVLATLRILSASSLLSLPSW